MSLIDIRYLDFRYLETSSPDRKKEVDESRATIAKSYKDTVTDTVEADMASKKIANRIKDAISLGSRPPSPPAGPPLARNSVLTPFTRHVLANLSIDNQKMFAMTVAPQIELDCDAQKLVFDDYYPLLGHTEKRTAIRTLKRAIPDNELLHTSVQDSTGRPRDVYMISVL